MARVEIVGASIGGLPAAYECGPCWASGTR